MIVQLILKLEQPFRPLMDKITEFEAIEGVEVVEFMYQGHGFTDLYLTVDVGEDLNQILWEAEVVSGERSLLTTDTVLVHPMWKTVQPFDVEADTAIATYRMGTHYHTYAWDELQANYKFDRIWNEDENWYVWTRKGES